MHDSLSAARAEVREYIAEAVVSVVTAQAELASVDPQVRSFITNGLVERIISCYEESICLSLPPSRTQPLCVFPPSILKNRGLNSGCRDVACFHQLHSDVIFLQAAFAERLSPAASASLSRVQQAFLPRLTPSGSETLHPLSSFFPVREEAKISVQLKRRPKCEKWSTRVWPTCLLSCKHSIDGGGVGTTARNMANFTINVTHGDIGGAGGRGAGGLHDHYSADELRLCLHYTSIGPLCPGETLEADTCLANSIRTTTTPPPPPPPLPNL